MGALRNGWYRFRHFFERHFSIYVTLILAVLLALYPNLFSIEKSCIDSEKYENLKGTLSADACLFIDKYVNKKIKSPKTFLKSIPANISGIERNHIIDLLTLRFDYINLHYIIILFVAATILILFLTRELTGAKKYSIAHSIRFLHKAIHCMRDKWNQVFVYDPKSGSINIVKDAAKGTIQESLDWVEKYFSAVTGTPCRACIKVMLGNEQPNTDQNQFKGLKGDRQNADATIVTWARSSGSTDPTTDRNDDRIDNNIDFEYIAVFHKPNYYKRNVDKPPYKNSHIDYQSNVKYSEQLGYRSAFTFGIRDYSTGKQTLYGFLCLDSPVTNAFSLRYDSEAAYLLADFYYLYLKKYIEVGKRFTTQGGANARQ